MKTTHMSESDGIDGVRRYPREKYFPVIEEDKKFRRDMK